MSTPTIVNVAPGATQALSAGVTAIRVIATAPGCAYQPQTGQARPLDALGPYPLDAASAGALVASDKGPLMVEVITDPSYPQNLPAAPSRMYGGRLPGEVIAKFQEGVDGFTFAGMTAGLNPLAGIVDVRKYRTVILVLSIPNVADLVGVVVEPYARPFDALTGGRPVAEIDGPALGAYGAAALVLGEGAAPTGTTAQILVAQLDWPFYEFGLFLSANAAGGAAGFRATLYGAY